MTCWIGVAAADHVAKGVAGNFAMFAHGKHTAAKRVKDGDKVTYYAPRTGINEGEIVRAFVAIGIAIPGDMSESRMTPEITGWQRPMRWLAARQTPIAPLLDTLSFVRDRTHWGMYFRRSLFSVPEQDFALIAGAMGVSSKDWEG